MALHLCRDGIEGGGRKEGEREGGNISFKKRWNTVNEVLIAVKMKA